MVILEHKLALKPQSLLAKKAAMKVALEMIEPILVEMGGKIGEEEGEKAGNEEASKIDWKTITDEKITEIRKQFEQIGTKTGQTYGIKITKTAFSQIKTESILEATKLAAFEAAEKYATKAREFCKMAVKIAEDAGGKAGRKFGLTVGKEAGIKAGQSFGKLAGRKFGLTE